MSMIAFFAVSHYTVMVLSVQLILLFLSEIMKTNRMYSKLSLLNYFHNPCIEHEILEHVRMHKHNIMYICTTVRTQSVCSRVDLQSCCLQSKKFSYISQQQLKWCGAILTNGSSDLSVLLSHFCKQIPSAS